MDQLKRSKTLTELAAERLRKAIIDNEYMLGEPLSESLLAESMGTSKTPVREALALLKIEGLVNIVPQKGTFVFTLSIEDVKKLIELRYILESAALKLAFERNRDLFKVTLGGIVLSMRNSLKINDLEKYLYNDAKFHSCFFDLCDNKYLADAYLQISTMSAALRTRISYQPSHPVKTCEEHETIYNYIVNDQLEKATVELHYHFSSFEKFYAEQSDEIVVSDVSSPRKNRKNNRGSK